MFGKIYGLECRVNHKIYVGQTHRTLEERFRKHKYANSLIGRAIRKYGEENFVKIILEECENQEQLDACEIKWIARLNCMFPNGYNLTAGGNGGCLGYKFSAETRAKISASLKGKLNRKSAWNKGKKTPPEVCVKISFAKKGKNCSIETRAKLSVARKGHKLSEEHLQKLIAARKGKPLTDEHKKKLSAAHKGKPIPLETRAKISAAKKGKPSPKKGTTIPPKTRAKISASLKAYYAKLKSSK